MKRVNIWNQNYQIGSLEKQGAIGMGMTYQYRMKKMLEGWNPHLGTLME